MLLFFFQAEDGIRDLVRSRGLGDVYKRQRLARVPFINQANDPAIVLVAKPGDWPGLDAVGAALSLIHI